jgi:OOP family OmpA-OmpF porin
MLNKTLLGFILTAAAAATFAQTSTNIQANPTSSAYAQDSRGVIARTPFGLCWRTGYWTSADAVPGCDGALTPPITEPAAPPIAAASEAPQTPALRCDFNVTLAASEGFGFNKTELTSATKKRIDTEVLDQLTSCSKIESIVVIGHTDYLGTPQYNRRLSEKRAEAVSAYLTSRGVAAPITIQAAGETEPVKSCSKKLKRSKLIQCLAPNRRVVVQVRGIAK